MNLATCARLLSGAATAASALLVIGAALWSIWRGVIVHDSTALIALAIILSPSVAALAAAIFAFWPGRAKPLFLLWVFAVGVTAPFIPPTVLEFVLPCPPPAVRCGVVGAASWPILLLCFVGFGLAYFAARIELEQQHKRHCQLATSGDPLKTLSALLALLAGAILIWLHYDFDERSIEGAVYVALRTERARAAGGIPFYDVVDGPSESLTILFGVVAMLTVGAASLRGSGRWLTYLWPFVLGAVWPQVMGILGSVGGFGWAYRSFAEKYGWVTLVAVCWIGLLIVQLAEKRLRMSVALSPKVDKVSPP